MICPNCDKDFEIEKTHGGQNRIFCFECFPNGLEKTVGNTLRKNLNLKMSNRMKISRGCDKCGYDKNPAALEWHHEGNDKINNPSELASRSWKKYLEEVEKCILVCANCHRDIHFPIK